MNTEYNDSFDEEAVANDESVTSDGTYTSKFPSFEEIHNQYNNGLLKGRHPRSFPKNSEMWHH